MRLASSFCKVFAASHDPGPYIDDGLTKLGQYDLSGDCTELEVTDSLAGDSSARITLLPRRPWIDYLTGGDHLDIYLGGNPTHQGIRWLGLDPKIKALADQQSPVFRGMIRTGTSTYNINSNGTPSLRFTLEANSDFWQRTTLYYHPHLGPTSRFGSYLPGMAQLMQAIPLQGTPVTLPRALLLSYMGYGGQLLLPRSYPDWTGGRMNRTALLRQHLQKAIALEGGAGFKAIRTVSGSQEAVASLLERLLKNPSNTLYPDSIVTLWDLFTYAEDLFVDGQIRNTPANDLSGTLLALLRQFSHPLLNEMFLSLLPSPLFSPDQPDHWGQRPTMVPSLVLRERPFGWFRGKAKPLNLSDPLGRPVEWILGDTFFSSRASPSEALILQGSSKNQMASRFVERLQIDRRVILSENLSRSTNEVVNFLSVVSSFSGMAQPDQRAMLFQEGIMPIFLPESIRRHGLQNKDLTTLFGQVEGGSISSPSQIAFLARIAFLQDLWYQNAAYYKAGSITLIGTPYLRPGMVVDILREDSTESFYVESVSHRWNATETGGRYTTTISVSRGQSGLEQEASRLTYIPPDGIKLEGSPFPPEGPTPPLVQRRTFQQAQTRAANTQAASPSSPSSSPSTTATSSSSTGGVTAPSTTTSIANNQSNGTTVWKGENAEISVSKAPLSSQTSTETTPPAPKDFVLPSSSREPDAKKEPSPDPKKEKEIRDYFAKCLNLTTLHETGFNDERRYNSLVENDLNAGMSWGQIQFNQKRGTLPQLFQAMARRDSASFQSIFGVWAATLLSPSFRTINLALVHGGFSDLRPRLLEASKVAAFRELQDRAARTQYFEPTRKLASRYNLKTDRAGSILMDISVQFGFQGQRTSLDKRLEAGFLRIGKKPGDSIDQGDARILLVFISNRADEDDDTLLLRAIGKTRKIGRRFRILNTPIFNDSIAPDLIEESLATKQESTAPLLPPSKSSLRDKAGGR